MLYSQNKGLVEPFTEEIAIHPCVASTHVFSQQLPKVRLNVGGFAFPNAERR